jgi:hypothetical protein
VLLLLSRPAEPHPPLVTRQRPGLGFAILHPELAAPRQKGPSAIVLSKTIISWPSIPSRHTLLKARWVYLELRTTETSLTHVIGASRPCSANVSIKLGRGCKARGHVQNPVASLLIWLHRCHHRCHRSIPCYDDTVIGQSDLIHHFRPNSRRRHRDPLGVRSEGIARASPDACLSNR